MRSDQPTKIGQTKRDYCPRRSVCPSPRHALYRQGWTPDGKEMCWGTTAKDAPCLREVHRVVLGGGR